MGIPDLPTPPEVSAQTKAGLKYHILGTIQQTLVVELQPGQVAFSDAGAMSWMTSTANMSTKASGGLGGMLIRVRAVVMDMPATARMATATRDNTAAAVRT